MFGCESRVREIEGLGPLVVITVMKIKSTKNLKEKRIGKKKGGKLWWGCVKKKKMEEKESWLELKDLRESLRAEFVFIFKDKYQVLYKRRRDKYWVLFWREK